MRWLLLLGLLASCRTSRPPSDAPVELDGAASVREVKLDFPEPGRGLVAFVLEVPGRERSDAAVSRVQWQLWLQERPFANGIVTLNQPLTPGQVTLVPVSQPLRYVFRGSRVGSHLLRARLEGEVTSIGASDETLRFDKRVSLDVDNPPLLESPEQ